ncbi:hypothetical protein FH972_021681 [Carpinus fangiana]|uniref:Uncharacterized protein n=1 Tax=Carpinus fangiana TaxID=176857 RepID=A0A5N6KQ02_9ROSI|nr:hypothetical protein FH972_021681 [Carpinus fangiana]
MPNPLSPLSSASLNRQNLSSLTSGLSSPVKNIEPLQSVDSDSAPVTAFSSSPFESNVSGPTRTSTQSDHSPSKTRGHSRMSPSKPFQIHEDEETETVPSPTFQFSSPGKKSVLSASDEVSPSKVPLPESSPVKTQTMTLRDLPDFKKPSMPASQYGNDFDTQSVMSDDTCFSNFSAVPNADMTTFARLGNRSPTRRMEAPTPSHTVFATPATSRRQRLASPSSRRHHQAVQDEENDTTNLLLDFTSEFGPVPGAAHSPAKSNTEPNLLSFINNQRNPSPAKSQRTPGTSRKMLNLLDFELPPQPTPRSVPSITVRELESLKSSYLSEISSLKASLSGRDAEVASLKRAVGDAERRAGEAMETTREERNRAEHAETEKIEWEKKGKEIEQVLKSVKEEFLQEEREKDDLQQRLEESNRAREDAELRLAEALTKANVAQSEVGSAIGDAPATEALVAQRVAQQLDEKMENLARELHSVYKKKHETKVATLKKTYEARSEKKCHELQVKIDELGRQVEELQASKDATLSEELPAGLMHGSRERAAEVARLDEQKSEIEEQKARIAGLLNEVSSVKSSHDFLLQELERERVEKGELVAAVDEMLLLQADAGATPGAAEVVEDFRRSISRPTGLRTPSVASESKIGRANSSIPSRSGSTKSRMMSNIERMGGKANE